MTCVLRELNRYQIINLRVYDCCTFQPYSRLQKTISVEDYSRIVFFFERGQDGRWRKHVADGSEQLDCGRSDTIYCYSRPISLIARYQIRVNPIKPYLPLLILLHPRFSSSNVSSIIAHPPFLFPHFSSELNEARQMKIDVLSPARSSKSTMLFPCRRAVCITPVCVVISISTTCIVHLEKISVSVTHLRRNGTR